MISSIKGIIIKTIAEARGLPLFLTEVKIEKLEDTDEGYKVSGGYSYTNPFNIRVAEKGSFEILLDKKLGVKSVNIFPK